MFSVEYNKYCVVNLLFESYDQEGILSHPTQGRG